MSTPRTSTHRGRGRGRLLEVVFPLGVWAVLVTGVITDLCPREGRYFAWALGACIVAVVAAVVVELVAHRLMRVLSGCTAGLARRVTPRSARTPRPAAPTPAPAPTVSPDEDSDPEEDLDADSDPADDLDADDTDGRPDEDERERISACEDHTELEAAERDAEPDAGGLEWEPWDDEDWT